MKIVKCADPTCNTHHELTDKVVTFANNKLVPTPSAWICDWHAEPSGALSDHVRAVDYYRSRPAQDAAPTPAGGSDVSR